MRFLLMVFFTFGCVMANAADLTRSDIERWVKSAPELQIWLEQQEGKLSELPESDTAYNLERAKQEGIQQLKNAGIYDELEQKVKQAGYQNAAQWIDHSQRISLAYLAVVLENEVGQRADIMAQIKQLETMEMPEANKAMMKAMLESSLAMLDAIESSTEADQKAVRPFIDKLSALIGDSE